MDQKENQKPKGAGFFLVPPFPLPPEGKRGEEAKQPTTEENQKSKAASFPMDQK